MEDNTRPKKLASNSIEKVKMSPNSWIKLRCNATSSLAPSSAQIRYKDSDLHWYKDGKLVQDDSRRLKKWVSSYDNSNYMELELYAIDPDDSGIYQCKRDNTVLKNVVLSVEDVNGARSFKCYTLIIHPLLLYIVLIYNL